MQAGLHIKSTLLALAISLGCLVLAQNAAPTTTTTTTTTTTSTPAPSPAKKCELLSKKPSPVVHNYNLTSCIVAKFAAYIQVNESSFVNLENGVVNKNSSKCEPQETTGNNTQNPKLVVDFTCGSVEFEINKNNSAIYVQSINGHFIKPGSPNLTFSNVSKLFATSETGHYYKCDSEQPIVVNATEKSVPAGQTYILALSDFAYEAYRTAHGTDFYKIAEECELDSGPFSDGVRIGVGVCLVAFVAIILIAYFVGRRRWSQRSSYESV